MRLSKKQARIIIIVLAILLGLSLTALAGTLIHNYIQSGGGRDSVIVPDNLVTPEKNSDPADAESTGAAEETEPAQTSEPVETTRATEAAEATQAAEPAPQAEPAPAAETVAPETQAAARSGQTQARASVISLYKNHESDNEPFQAMNLFPGDVETKYYCVRVSHNRAVTVHFRIDIREGSEKLAEVLQCRVVLATTGQTLYEGLMRDMPKDLSQKLEAPADETSELYYEITAYLDTSVGNEYQDKGLIADFVWWTEDDLQPPPQTGDMAVVGPLICLAVCSAAGLAVLILLGGKRRREEDTNG